MANRGSKLIFTLFVLAVLAAASIGICHVFAAPASAPPRGVGAIGVDSALDISVGTSTGPNGLARFLVQGSSTNASDYALQAVNSAGTVILAARDNGGLSIGGASDPGAGGLSFSGNFSGTVDASNIAAGAFQSGAYSFASPSMVTVNGTTTATDYCIGLSCISSWSTGGAGWTTVGTSVVLATSTNYVGIGPSTPTSPLTVSGGEVDISNSGAAGVDIQDTASSISGALFAGGSNVVLGFPNTVGLEVESLPAADLYPTPTGVPADTVLYVGSSGDVGIGMSAPTYELDVASGGATTARFGTASADTVVIGGGSGILTVGTVDPVYTINGNKFETYGAEMTGVKGETTGAIDMPGTDFVPGGTYSYTLDLAGAGQGSDLWLFKETTQIIKNNLNGLVVILTPGFDGNVWYVKNPTQGTVTIFAAPSESETSLEVSYRLTAPRFDAGQWSNIGTSGAPAGILIND